MLHGVVFDFDGIIVDTEPLHYRSFQLILEPMGLGYSWDDYVAEYMGYDDRDAFNAAFRAVGRSLSPAQLDDLISRKAATFQSVISHGVQPYPGVVELIRSISGSIPLALCSGALRSDIAPILIRLGLQDAFDVIVTADDVAASKPDPESYRRAVSGLKQHFSGREIDSGCCVAIEDTPAGIASATGAGLRVVAVTNSYAADRLAAATQIVPSLKDVSVDDLHRLV